MNFSIISFLGYCQLIQINPMTSIMASYTIYFQIGSLCESVCGIKDQTTIRSGLGLFIYTIKAVEVTVLFIIQE